MFYIYICIFVQGEGIQSIMECNLTHQFCDGYDDVDDNYDTGAKAMSLCLSRKSLFFCTYQKFNRIPQLIPERNVFSLFLFSLGFFCSISLCFICCLSSEGSVWNFRRPFRSSARRFFCCCWYRLFVFAWMTVSCSATKPPNTLHKIHNGHHAQRCNINFMIFNRTNG